MKRSNDGQPDVRGGDLRTSVPVVFSPYKLCFSLFANINDCHGQSWHSQHSAVGEGGEGLRTVLVLAHVELVLLPADM